MSVRGGGMSQNEGVQERILSTRNDFRCLPSTLAPVFCFFALAMNSYVVHLGVGSIFPSKETALRQKRPTMCTFRCGLISLSRRTHLVSLVYTCWGYSDAQVCVDVAIHVCVSCVSKVYACLCIHVMYTSVHDL